MATFEELQRLVSMEDTKTNLLAFTGTIKELVIALATDTNQLGIYDGTTWYWMNSYIGISPISISGSNISLSNSTVSAGTYLAANIVVNAQGLITSASNGVSASSVGAPSNSPFLTSASTPNLTNYQILTAGSNITITSASSNGGQLIISASSGGGGAYPQYFSAFFIDFKYSGTLTTNYDSTQMFNNYWYQSSPSNGDEFTIPVLLDAATYTFTVVGATESDCGMLDYYLNSTLIASGQDWYSSGHVANIIKTFSYTISTPGLYTFKIKVNGKNGSSNNYYAVFTRVWIRPS